MCNPYDITKAVVDTVRVAVEVKKAVENKKEAKYQNELIKTEAKQARQEASYERQEGIEEARRKKLRSILSMGETQAELASGNIALSSATALNIYEDEKQNGELDALMTLNSSEKRAEKYMQQSQKYYANAALNSFNAKNSFVNSLFGSTLTLASKTTEHIQDAKGKGIKYVK